MQLWAHLKTALYRNVGIAALPPRLGSYNTRFILNGTKPNQLWLR